MGFFDEALSKAKDTIEVIGKKTDEVVGIQKIKFEISSNESKCEKDYAKLGKILFSARDNFQLSDEMKELVENITLKNDRINQLKAELNKAKNRRFCPNCAATIEMNSKYCSSCGAQVVFDSSDKED